jgi:hypothetical protein
LRATGQHGLQPAGYRTKKYIFQGMHFATFM